MEVFQHTINQVMEIQNKEEIISFKQLMPYRGFETFTDMCKAFSYMLDNIHYHSGYKLDGLRYALKFGTMSKIRLFIKWMFTSMRDKTFELYAEDLLAAIQQLQARRYDQDGKGTKITTSWSNLTHDYIYWSYKGNHSF